MQLKRALLTAALCFSAAAAAPALAIVITDTVNPTDTTIAFGSIPTPCSSGFTCSTSTLSFIHDITDNGFTLGSLVTSATLDIHLLDDAGGGSEAYTYNIGAAQPFSSANVPSGSGSTDHIVLNAASLADLQADGKIAVSIISTSGAFLFADSTLTAQVTPAATGRIPEPATLTLLGLALIGLGLTRRRDGRI